MMLLGLCHVLFHITVTEWYFVPAHRGPHKTEFVTQDDSASTRKEAGEVPGCLIQSAGA